MIKIRKAGERGYTELDWLKSYHGFSFDEFYDPEYVSFRSLRVLNEDRVAPSKGFDTHPHRDMEIVTYVLSGSLQHKDSLGNGSIIKPGEVQRMTAGTGVRHSEYNPSATEGVHFLQIWILPEKKGLKPGYEQKTFPMEGRKGRFQLLASRDASEGSVTVHQDMNLWGALLPKSGKLDFELKKDRHAWIQVAKGELELNGENLGSGDGAAVSEESLLHITATRDSEILLFDLE